MTCHRSLQGNGRQGRQEVSRSWRLVSLAYTAVKRPGLRQDRKARINHGDCHPPQYGLGVASMASANVLWYGNTHIETLLIEKRKKNSSTCFYLLNLIFIFPHIFIS